jgi:hypothetical protein
MAFNSPDLITCPEILELQEYFRQFIPEGIILSEELIAERRKNAASEYGGR